MAAASRFGLKPTEAKAILREVFDVVETWRDVGRRFRLKGSILDAYQSAFDNPLMSEAKTLLGSKKSRSK